MKIKLKDIAQKLKVTKVTVSKVLRGNPDISKATVELRKTVTEMGHMSNFIARNFSSKTE